jgi:hypothetical protein
MTFLFNSDAARGAVFAETFAPRESGALPERLIADDTFFILVMKPGFVEMWKTIETVRKIYVTVNG